MLALGSDWLQTHCIRLVYHDGGLLVDVSCGYVRVVAHGGHLTEVCTRLVGRCHVRVCQVWLWAGWMSSAQ